MAEAPNISPTLPFGDINLVVVTDVHSWVAGHGDNEGLNNLDVSYGDVVSFYGKLQQHCLAEDCDLWLVQNGDWIDGTGISMRENSTSLINVLKQIPFDVLNTGNHDLYSGSVIQETQKAGGFLEHWGPKHLSSNVYMANSTKPMSNRYHILEGKHSTILVFGFIYDLQDPADVVRVQPVEDAVQEAWFRDVLQDSTIDYNAILVMLHAGVDDPSVEIIRQAIRTLLPDSDMPIQFVAGHTHMRRHGIADARSKIVESGRYLDTVGWISFPNLETIRDVSDNSNRKLQRSNFTEMNEVMHPPNEFNATTDELDAATDLFRHVFLDANRQTLRTALGLPPKKVYQGDDDIFQTEKGLEVADFIQTTRDNLGLTKHIGCAPQDYLLNQSMKEDDSLWRLYRDEVGPYALETAVLYEPDTNNFPRYLFVSQDSWRYGLYGGNHLTVDDVIAVSPFDEPIYRVTTLSCDSIRQLNEIMNPEGEKVWLGRLPAWILSPQQLQDVDTCELYVNHFGLSRVQAGLEKLESPVEWHPLETNLTTTNIWLKFVQDEWHCDGDTSDGVMVLGGLSFENSSLIMVMLAVSLVLVLCTFIIKCFRRRKRANANHGYDGVMVDSSVVAAADSHDETDDCDDGDEPPVRIV